MFRLSARRPRRRATAEQHSLVSWESEGVRTAVVRLESGSAQIVGASQAPTPAATPRGLPDVDACAQGCDEALVRAEDMTVRYCGRKLVPDWATMCVPPEITRSQPVVVRRRRREPTAPITREELESLIRLGYRTAQDEMGASPKEMGEDLVFGSLSEITVDDQVAVDPLGLHGNEIQARLDFYRLPLEWISGLEIVADRLGLQIRSIVPQQAAYAASIPDPSALLVVIGPHQTSVSSVLRGRLEWSALAPVGSEDMISSTARALELSGGQADALMAAYRAGRLQADVENQLARVFWAELKKWMLAMANAIEDSLRGTKTPHQCYVVDAADRIPEAAMSLQTPFWENLLPFDRCPEVRVLGTTNIRNVLDLSTRASGNQFLCTRALAHLAADVYTDQDGLDCALVDTIHWQIPRI